MVLEVLHVGAHEVRAAEPAGAADQQQGLVPDVDDPVPHAGYGGPDVLGGHAPLRVGATPSIRRDVGQLSSPKFEPGSGRTL